IVHRRKTELVVAMAAAGDIPLRPGVATLVAALVDAQVDLHVATTGTRDWVEPLLGHHFPHGTFDVVVTGTDVPELKPHPAVYLSVLARAGLSVERTLAVEDSRNGLHAAHAAGLRCVVTPGRYTDPADVADADLLVPDATQLDVQSLVRVLALPAPSAR
ncbi:MAG: HAD-IA family hydrolase, partial [Micrococcales bacterium]|nr:HAD-IA family hydrolase [Micrococcales bacterium]